MVCERVDEAIRPHLSGIRQSGCLDFAVKVPGSDLPSTMQYDQ